MHASGPIEMDKRFRGGVVAHSASDWRLVATDPAVEDIDRATFASPAEAARVARLVVLRSSGPGPRPHQTPPDPSRDTPAA